MDYTKRTLLSSLELIQQNYLFGTCLLERFPVKEWDRIGIHFFSDRSRPLGDPQALQPLIFPLDSLSQRMKDPKQRVLVQQRFEVSLRRSLARESHEEVEWYCGETQQMQKFKDWPHYDFSTLLRNLIAHGKRKGTIIWPRHLKGKVVSWRDITITKNIHGQELKMSDQRALYFNGDLLKFAADGLT